MPKQVFGDDVEVHGRLIIKPSGLKGTIELPILTTEQRDRMPIHEGSMIFNSTTKETEVVENGAWRKSANVATIEAEQAHTVQRFQDRDDRLDAGEAIVGANKVDIDNTVAANEVARDVRMDARKEELDQTFTEMEVTQEVDKQEILASQVVTQGKVDAAREKMAETLLPLTGEEIPEQLNPITLMDLPQYIYWNESEYPFQFGGGTLKRESGSWLNGEEVIVLIQTKESGGWSTIWDEKFSEPVDFEKKKLPVTYNDGSGLRISIKQKSEGDGYHIWSYSFISAEREGG